MINDHPAKAVKDLSNNIRSISFSGHGMEEFSVFITKLHHTMSIPLLPIFSLHAEQISNMSFNDISEIEFMREEGSELFKTIQKDNYQVAVGNPCFKVGEIFPSLGA
jgi:predicted glycosyltransferase